MNAKLFLVAACAVFPSALLAENKYHQHNLVSDLPGIADRQDANMVNPWGIAFSATSPFWIVNNHSGTATLYDGSGNAVNLVVAIPNPTGSTPAAPTGQVFNGGTGFVLNGAKPASFLFCSEDGTISGWYGGIDGNKAAVAVDNSASGAVYKGMALGAPDSGPLLYAANFNSGQVEVYGPDFTRTLSGAFSDPALPAGFAPFNIYVFAHKVYVAYAKQDDQKHDDFPGNGNGYIDVFDENGALQQRLVSGGQLNSPWGMAMAPAGFGDFANALLVGNFGDGTINAYDPATGAFICTLSSLTGKPIVNSGLWALQFGNGKGGGDPLALYFTAGISGGAGEAIESHGLFGVIQAAPALSSDHVVNAAGFQNLIAPNTWVTILGQNLSATTRGWLDADFKGGLLPTQLDGVSATIDGKPAYIAYISPTQINMLSPASLGTGNLTVQTQNGDLPGNSVSVPSQLFSPALFKQDDRHAFAAHADGSVVNTAKPAEPGELIVLYGTGFGSTDPAIPEGALVSAPAAMVHPAQVTVGGASAPIVFQGLTATGLYQFNVNVPSGLAAGDASISLQVAGANSPDGVLLAVDAPATPPPPPPYGAQIDNFAFSPNPLNVAGSGILTWTNKQGVDHTVVSDTGKFQSQVLSQGDTFTTTLTAPGTYAYHCSIHPFMKGQIVVK